MKLTAWQQFSSNHSSHYTIVGHFATEEAAQQAGAEVLAFLKAVGRWWQELAPWEKKENEKIADYYRDHLTPPEAEITQKYNLTEYDRPLEWCGSEDAASRAVAVMKNVVVINNDWQTYNLPFPFVELFTKLGGVPYYELQEEQSVVLSIYCEFRDEATAEAAWSHIRLGEEYGFPAFFIPACEEALWGAPVLDAASIRFPELSLSKTQAPLWQKLFTFLEQFPHTSLTYDITEIKYE